jgi:SNF2 family DNA or RNA helicase
VQIVENKALLLNVRDPNRITEVIPRSKVLDSGQVLVKWGLEEAQVLKNLRIKNVPSPIKNKYEWTGLYKPFDHQKETASFLTLHRRAFCFNEQGTGKTSSVIWAADYLIKEKFINRVLVICPLSIMQSAWEADLFKFAMHRTCAIAHSYSKEKRIQAIQSDADFVIINYDGLEIIKDEISNAKFDLIVVDEANAYKNVQTKRWKILASVIRPETWVWMLTGTPASQSPTDAYGLAKLINPTGVPKFFGAFRDMVLQKITQFKWIPKPSSERVVHQVLQPAIRYTKEECLDLPDMTYVTREVPLSAQQNKFYEAIRNNMMTVAAGEEITTVNAAVNLNKLLQLSCGAVYSDSGEIVAFDAKNRMTALLEVIEEASHKVMQAAAHGVTLHAANVVVWWGPITSIETYLQANARVHRAGQRNPCTVVHLQGSPVEKRVYKMLSEKVDIHTRLIDLYKNILLDT